MPMRITALQSQMKNPERVNVFIDGHFTLSVNVLIIEQMGLEVGQELSTGQLEELRRQAALQQALDRALNFLTYRPRSRQELRHYLRRKDTPPEVIETVLERLDHLDLVNDRDFASFWVENREQFSPRGEQGAKRRTCSSTSPVWIMSLFSAAWGHSCSGAASATRPHRTP